MDEEWFEHDGAVMPSMCAPNDVVQVRFRDGVELGSRMTAAWWGPAREGGKDSNWLWDDENTAPDYQIVAYRVVRP